MSINLEPSILDNVEIASPCSASWDDMKGNDRVRDCSQCKLSVYNLSVMSGGEAENLIREREGRLCVRLYRRADGTVISDNCPVALRKIRDSLKHAARIAATALSFFLSFSFARASDDNTVKDNSRGPAKSAVSKVTKSGSPVMGELEYVPKRHIGANGAIIKGSPPRDRYLQGQIRLAPGQVTEGKAHGTTIPIQKSTTTTVKSPESKTQDSNSPAKSEATTKPHRELEQPAE
jgi:hypothetical protein